MFVVCSSNLGFVVLRVAGTAVVIRPHPMKLGAKPPKRGNFASGIKTTCTSIHFSQRHTLIDCNSLEEP